MMKFNTTTIITRVSVRPSNTSLKLYGNQRLELDVLVVMVGALSGTKLI
jgi:hypothetical protein